MMDTNQPYPTGDEFTPEDVNLSPADTAKLNRIRRGIFAKVSEFPAQFASYFAQLFPRRTTRAAITAHRSDEPLNAQAAHEPQRLWNRIFGVPVATSKQSPVHHQTRMPESVPPAPADPDPQATWDKIYTPPADRPLNATEQTTWDKLYAPPPATPLTATEQELWDRITQPRPDTPLTAQQQATWNKLFTNEEKK